MSLVFSARHSSVTSDLDGGVPDAEARLEQQLCTQQQRVAFAVAGTGDMCRQYDEAGPVYLRSHWRSPNGSHAEDGEHCR